MLGLVTNLGRPTGGARAAGGPARQTLGRRRTWLASLAACVAASVGGIALWAAGSPTAGAGTLLAAACAGVAATIAAQMDARAREQRQQVVGEQRLADELIGAEQDERRRLAILLHDGPLQNLSGIALMHDATLAALRDGNVEDGARLLESSLARERKTIQTLRDLMFALEPLVLRDHGFAAAAKALAETIERDGTIAVSLDVSAGERLPEKAQVALYQLLREALGQARKRLPDRISVDVVERGDGSFGVSIADDGVEERRRASIEALRDRSRVLRARVEMDTGATGTVVRIFLPAYAAGAGAGTGALAQSA
jgi:signal transduction histidine kinase